MTGKLKIDLKRAIKYSWIATSISLFQLGLGTYVLYPDQSFTNNDASLYFMFLSFPSSIPTVVLTFSFIDVDPPFDYVVLFFVAFTSGYLQWFWWIPRILQKPDIISLRLANPERAIDPTVAKPTRRRESHRSKLPRAPFDKAGHSPLERAIGIKRRYN